MTLGPPKMSTTLLHQAAVAGLQDLHVKWLPYSPSFSWSIPSLNFPSAGSTISRQSDRSAFSAKKGYQSSVPSYRTSKQMKIEGNLSYCSRLPKNSLITPRLPDVCKEDVQSLYQLGDEKDPNTLCLVTAALHPPPRGGTENAFISFWDANIRSVIETLIPYGTIIRNSNQHTETRNLRPDFGCLMSNKCVFRGEEKGPNNNEDVKVELGKKLLKWVYSPAPYVLGYYCNASVMTLVAITPPVRKLGMPIVHDLMTVDLSVTKGRIDNIRHLINLASLLKPLADMISSAGSEYEPVQRRHCTVK